MAVTKLEDIRNQFEQEVDIRGFEEGQFITLKLRHISLLALLSNGTIPNSLMSSAGDLFQKGGDVSEADTASMIKETGVAKINELVDMVCENVVIEPAWNDLKPYMTDDQKMEIFYYAQGGLRQVQKFREEQRDHERNLDSKNI